MTKKSTMSKILIIEDDPDIRELLRFNLEKAGYNLFLAEDGEKALTLARQHAPDIILLDLMLPGVDGLEVCRTLKKDPELQRIPVMMVTAKGEEMDRVVGLELGADDYVVKPFSLREVVLRIRKVLDRGEKQAAPAILKADPLVLDLDAHTARLDDQFLELTATEFRLLTYLLRHRGRVQTREMLLDRVWGYSFEGYARTIDTHVRRLRKKMGAAQNLIETVRGVGYRFQAQE